MAHFPQMAPSTKGICRMFSHWSRPGVLIAGGVLVLGLASPALAERCTTNQNGQTICCDNSGNCWSK